MANLIRLTPLVATTAGAAESEYVNIREIKSVGRVLSPVAGIAESGLVTFADGRTLATVETQAQIVAQAN